jgi:hypothetical protein
MPERVFPRHVEFMPMVSMFNASDLHSLGRKMLDEFDDKRSFAAVLSANDVDRLHSLSISEKVFNTSDPHEYLILGVRSIGKGLMVPPSPEDDSVSIRTNGVMSAGTPTG